MTILVQALQVLNGLVWLLPLVTNAGPLWRLLKGHARGSDAFFAVAFFIALAQMGFIARWIIWPHSLPSMEPVELAFWGTCYFLNAVGALAIEYVRWRTER